MIKTLRITSILAAVLATVLVGFFVFRIARGIRGNENVKEFLDSPDVIEKFKAAEGNRTNTSAGQISPLVKQAQAFALYLNPPAKSGNPKTGKGLNPISPQLNVTPKFKVIGISLFEKHPEMSMALIDEPGKGIHWVKQSTTVGHLFIELVQNDLVIVKSGTETFNLVLEREKPESKSQVTDKSSIPKKPAGATGSPASRAQPSYRNRSIAKRVPQKPLPSKQPEERTEELQKQLYEDLKELRDNSDMNDSELSEEERAEQIKKIISSFKASYVSPEEAKKLDDLAEKLKDDESEPNTTDTEEELPTE